MTLVSFSSPISRLRALGAYNLVLALLFASACGGGGGGSTPGATSPFDLPVVVNAGGPVLSAPSVQPIYFPGFAFQTDIDTFLSKLPGSSYWPTAVSEYGVGALTIRPSVVTSVSSGTAQTDATMAGLLAQVFAADGASLGAPSGDTIYLLMFPSTTTITAQGQVMCGDSAPSGYHTEFALNGTNVSGVILPSCPNYAGDTTLTGVQALTPTISHEVIESATDPLTTTQPAYSDVDDRHAIWSVAINGGEIADLCENETPDLIVPDDIGYPVQRVWSNAAANAGQSPCVPVPPGELFFIAVPSLPDEVAVTRGGKSFSVPAITATLGAQASVSVSMRSQNNGVASWGVGALEYHSDNASVPQPTAVKGLTGQTLHVTVVPNEVASGLFPLIVASVNQNALHFWIGAINRK